MAAYKDEQRGTWYVSFHYYDWTGKNCRKVKRGFKTKREATECAPLSSREDDTATGSKGDPDPLRGSKGKNLQARRRGYVLSGV